MCYDSDGDDNIIKYTNNFHYKYITTTTTTTTTTNTTTTTTAYNLCYSTLLRPDDLTKLPEEAYEKSPSNDYFVRSSTRKGILPQILDELLAARKVSVCVYICIYM